MATQPTLGAVPSDRGTVVRSPLPTDGVGRALRQVFDRDSRLPRPLVECLRRLDETDH